MLAAAWAAEPPKERILTISERLDRYMANHCCMIEVSSGTATLCSVAKQYGLDGSIALDKTKKRGAKATIFVFDILDPKDKELLYHWHESDLLAWAHNAPVCGTCSRARQIRNGGPRPFKVG
jgi:hypothetical protein